MNNSTISTSNNNNNNRTVAELLEFLSKPPLLSMSIQCLDCEMENAFHDIVSGNDEISENQMSENQENKPCRGLVSMSDGRSLSLSLEEAPSFK